jgi:hypothetical protein
MCRLMHRPLGFFTFTNLAGDLGDGGRPSLMRLILNYS